MDSAFCGLHNDKYIKFQSIGNCRLRALVESLKVLEKFKIGERKVHIIAMIG